MDYFTNLLKLTEVRINSDFNGVNLAKNKPEEHFSKLVEIHEDGNNYNNIGGNTKTRENFQPDRYSIKTSTSKIENSESDFIPESEKKSKKKRNSNSRLAKESQSLIEKKRNKSRINTDYPDLEITNISKKRDSLINPIINSVGIKRDFFINNKVENVERDFDSKIIKKQIFLKDVLNWVENDSKINENNNINPLKYDLKNSDKLESKEFKPLIKNYFFQSKSEKSYQPNNLRQEKEIQIFKKKNEKDNITTKEPNQFKNDFEIKDKESRVTIGSINLIVERSPASEIITNNKSPKMIIGHSKNDSTSSYLSRNYIRI